LNIKIKLNASIEDLSSKIDLIDSENSSREEQTSLKNQRSSMVKNNKPKQAQRQKQKEEQKKRIEQQVKIRKQQQRQFFKNRELQSQNIEEEKSTPSLSHEAESSQNDATNKQKIDTSIHSTQIPILGITTKTIKLDPCLENQEDVIMMNNDNENDELSMNGANLYSKTALTSKSDANSINTVNLLKSNTSSINNNFSSGNYSIKKY
jgi:hypothetical protein